MVLYVMAGVMATGLTDKGWLALKVSGFAAIQGRQVSPLILKTKKFKSNKHFEL
jgi:hypothetical protein